jgi:thymidylate kinase
MSVFIIEGPDLAGKTTAIESIAKFYNRGIIIKNSFKPKIAGSSRIYRQYWAILHLVSKYDDLVILDRFYPSQAVYSILRGLDEMFSENVKDLEEHCVKNLTITYIYLDTNLDELETRYKKRGDEHINIEQLKLLKQRYDLFYDSTILPKVKVNTMNENWMAELHNTLVAMGSFTNGGQHDEHQ